MWTRDSLQTSFGHPKVIVFPSGSVSSLVLQGYFTNIFLTWLTIGTQEKNFIFKRNTNLKTVNHIFMVIHSNRMNNVKNFLHGTVSVLVTGPWFQLFSNLNYSVGYICSKGKSSVVIRNELLNKVNPTSEGEWHRTNNDLRPEELTLRHGKRHRGVQSIRVLCDLRVVCERLYILVLITNILQF